MDEIRTLKNNVKISDVVEKVTNQTLKPKGRENVGFCPFHNDKKASLMVNDTKQIFACFACDTKGDVIDFLKETFSSRGESDDESFKKAIQYLKEQSGEIVIDTKKESKQKKRVVWEPLEHGPEILPSMVHYRHGKPNSYWCYRTAYRKPIGYICRFDLPDGSKETLPLVFCTDGTNRQWRWQAFKRPRPLFALDLMKEHPKKTILLVEGEKAAAAGQKLLPHVIVSTWPGGTNAVDFANFDPLEGRNVLLWPDNDKCQQYGPQHQFAGKVKPWHEQPGNKAMLSIAAIIKPFTNIVKWIRNDERFPDKWDIADADWTNLEAKAYATANLIDVPTIKDPKENSTVPGEAMGPEPIPAELPDQQPTSSIDHAIYFSFLGYERTESTIYYYFYIKNLRFAMRIAAGNLSKTHSLVTLAPLDFWESNFSTGKSKKIQFDLVLNWAMACSHAKGLFIKDSLRGRGAWTDGKDIIFHAGNHLLINGKKTKLGEYESNFIYEESQPLGYDIKTPANNKSASKLLDILKLCNWGRDVDAFLLAGWIVIAPLCGALKWRPHIWLTGGAGSGKSWILYNIIRFMLGESAIAVQSATTEAGLRQHIKNDAMPIVFDEAEGENQEQQQGIKKILELMRAASSDDGGLLVKGSADGVEKKYRIRSCFAFASIGYSPTQESDRTRITALSLEVMPNSPKKQKRWGDLQKMHHELFTEQFSKDFRARSLKLLPIILENANTFANAAAAILGKKRLGDQIGFLIAGAYSLTSAKLINYDDALAWIADRDWSEERQLDESRDEMNLLSYILEYSIRIERGAGSVVQRTIGDLLSIAIREKEDETVTDMIAENHLLTIGIKIHEKMTKDSRLVYMAISNSSTRLGQILSGTPWRSNWSRILKRIDNSILTEPKRFTAGVVSRCVAIPTKDIFKSLEVVETDPVAVDDLPF